MARTVLAASREALRSTGDPGWDNGNGGVDSDYQDDTGRPLLGPIRSDV